jgi:transposase-like protein
MSAAVAGIGQDDGLMSPSGPRAGGPRSRRVFTVREKFEHVAAYEVACADGTGGGEYLRREGLYSSQITDWRRLRDAGMLTGKPPAAARVGRPAVEQAEIARLTRELDTTQRRLAKTEAALDVLGKVHALLGEISGSADTEQQLFKR